MNSLSELNGYAAMQVEIAIDTRPTDFEFTTTSNQSVTTWENQPFISPAGFDITKIVNAPDDMSFSVNVASLPGTTVTWNNTTSTTGSAMTVSSAAGAYTISGIKVIADWELVKAPTITMPVNPPNNWSYTSTLHYWNVMTRPWTTGVTVVQLEQLSTASDFYYAADTISVLSNTPSVQNLGVPGLSNDNLTLTLVPNIDYAVANLSSTSTLGGITSFNPIAGVYTIQGNLAQVNDHLVHISYTPPADSEVNWIATYYLYNASSDFTSSTTQHINNLDAIYMSKPSTYYYNEDITTQVTSTPSITDTVSGATSYVMTVVPSSGAGSVLSSSGSGGTSSFNSSTITLTISGTKTQVNSHLANLYLKTPTDYRGTTNLVYSLSLPGSVTAVRTQVGYVSALDTNISYMSLDRSFVQNTAAQLVFGYPNIPQILEEIAGATYTVFFTSTAGKFGTSTSDFSTNFAYSGTKSQVNAFMSTLKFWPYKGVYGNQTFTYTQQRNGVTKETVTVGFIGSLLTTPIPGSGTTVYTSTGSISSFTPTYEQLNYLSCDMLVVGGGGGGSCGGGGISIISAGGGGGGAVVYQSNVSLTGDTLNIQVGEGGLRGGESVHYTSGTSPWMTGTAGGYSRVYTSAGNLFVANGGGIALSFTSGYSNIPYDSRAGTSGNGNLGAGSLLAPVTTNGGTAYTGYAAGGGGGAGGVGSVPTSVSVAGFYTYSATQTSLKGGDGGPGVNCSITGTTIEYGRGGGGFGAYSGSQPDSGPNGTIGSRAAYVDQSGPGGWPNGQHGGGKHKCEIEPPYTGAVNTDGVNYGDGGGSGWYVLHQTLTNISGTIYSIVDTYNGIYGKYWLWNNSVNPDHTAISNTDYTNVPKSHGSGDGKQGVVIIKFY